MNIRKYTEEYAGRRGGDLENCSFNCGRSAVYLYHALGDWFLMCHQCYIAIQQIENGGDSIGNRRPTVR